MELDIDVNNLSLNNTVAGSVIIIETGNTLNAASVLNPGRPVSIEVEQGPLGIGAINGSVVSLMPATGSGLRAITDTNGTSLNITATGLNFSALDGFGTLADPIETKVTNPLSVDTSLGEIGITQIGNLSLLGNLGTTGHIRLGASGGQVLIQDQSITSSAGTIRLSGSIVKVEALGASTQVNAAGNLYIVDTGSLIVQGSNTTISGSAKLVAGTGISINAGDVSIIGGDADFAVASIDPVVLNMNLSGLLSLSGGAGYMSEAQLAADSVALNVLGDISLTGGSGTDAFASINAFSGDVVMSSGSIALPGEVMLTQGSGSNADAVILANSGQGLVDISAGVCTNCTELGADPFLDSASQEGIFGSYTFTLLEPPVIAEVPVPVPDEEIIDIGTDQLIVLNDYQEDVIVGVVDPDDDDDEEKRELVCR